MAFFSLRLRRLVCSVLLIFSIGLFRPVPAEASWAAMWIYAQQAVHQAVDIWERNQRIIEDHLDQAGGTINAFSTLNTAYRTVRSRFAHLGLDPEPSRLGDLFRATLGERECYLAGPTFIGSRDCSVFAILDAAGVRQYAWAQPLLSFLVGQPFDFWLYEEAVHGSIEPGGAPWEGRPYPLPADPIPTEIADIVAHTSRSVQAERSYRRGRENQRRLASVTEYSRLAAEQVLTDPRRSGNVGDSFGTCLTGAPLTLLGQANDADCTPAGTEMGGIPDPSGGAGAHENLSESEVRVINVQLAIAETMMLAAQLEEAAIVAEEGLAMETLTFDIVEEKTQDLLRRIQYAAGNGPANCLTYAYAAECAAGHYTTRTRAQQEADLAFYINLH